MGVAMVQGEDRLDAENGIYQGGGLRDATAPGQVLQGVQRGVQIYPRHNLTGCLLNLGKRFIQGGGTGGCQRHQPLPRRLLIPRCAVDLPSQKEIGYRFRH